MSGAYEGYHRLDDIDIGIALEVGLLTECEYHSGEYYDAGGDQFEEVEDDVKNLLSKYDLTPDEYNKVLKSIKDIQNMYKDACVLCSRHI